LNQTQQQSPKTLKKITFANSWFAFLLLAIVLAIPVIYLASNPPTWGPFYKEYSSLQELYNSTALGDLAKISVNVLDPKPSSQDGTIKFTNNSGKGIFFRVPIDTKNRIELLPGKNILYVKATARQGNTMIYDILEAKP
jgi:hypothetical protein